jgi:outer membrane receptor protein involved in Fe transport
MLIFNRLFANFTPYGSARVDIFYDMLDADANDGENSRILHDMNLSEMSHFGVNFEHEYVSANIEFNAVGEINTLWGRYSFSNWSLLFGLDYDGTDKLAAQARGGEMGLNGWGSVFGGTRVQARFECDNGFYLSLVKPFTGDDPAENTLAINTLTPMIIIGYNYSGDRFSFYPTAVFQVYNYDNNFGAGHDGWVQAWLLSTTFRYTAEPMTISVNFNYGINTGNMGYDGPSNFSMWDPVENKTIDTTTLGGFLMLGYELTDNFSLNTGVGYTISSNDKFDEDDSRMGFYLQGSLRCGAFSIIPEVGMMMAMDDILGAPEGNTMYAGVSLRFDF